MADPTKTPVPPARPATTPAPAPRPAPPAGGELDPEQLQEIAGGVGRRDGLS
ncbi:hypothetical protein [Pseudoroseomonas cervicalis]|uniref:hypothetical protein n=1 Tax=Teichococcus cervicalis TaxID=204525 RepID=UPI0022F1BBD1|nr:hypothetical protein [Pseudoroseomonas cervicalis]WBV44930.1 hypothetical protein PFY06_17635 [Pseudoroseomonas cervicalis]